MLKWVAEKGAKWVQSWQGVAMISLVFLGTLLMVAPDYGLSWDEPYQAAYGEAILDYVQGQSDALLTHSERYYGPVVPAFFSAVQRVIKPENSQQMYVLRHQLNALIFGIGVVFLGLGVAANTGSAGFGWVAALVLILSPRLWADGFYNSKDIPFMVGGIVAAWSAQRVLAQHRVRDWLLHAVICALVIDMRILGLLFPVLTVGIALIQTSGRKAILKMAGFGGLCVGLVVLFWPTLWQHPFQNFLMALTRMSHYPWNGQVLYMGKFVWANALPWHYVPVWIGITTPILWLGLGLVGLGISAVHVHKSPIIAFVWGWLLLPLISIWVLQSVLYDGWRHVFFIYPAFIWLGCLGLNHLKLSVKVQKVGLVVGGGYALWILSWMVMAHPYQNVYFNFLAGSEYTVRTRFEVDYWGLSYRKLLETIVESSARPVAVFAANFPGQANALMLTPDQQSKLRFVADPRQAEVAVTNYRWHPEDFPLLETDTVWVGELKVASTYRIR